jgi:hypothetical protein
MKAKFSNRTVGRSHASQADAGSGCVGEAIPRM